MGPPKDAHILLTEVYEYVSRHGKKSTLKLQMELNLLISWPQDREFISWITQVGQSYQQGL